MSAITYYPQVRKVYDGWQCRVIQCSDGEVVGVVYSVTPYLTRRGAAKDARRWIKRALAERGPGACWETA